MLPRIVTSDSIGIITAGLVRLCALVLFVSLFGPWDFYQYREGSAWVTEVYLGDGLEGGLPTAQWPLILLPLSGALLFLFVVRPVPMIGTVEFAPTDRRGMMVVAAAWFTVAAVVLLLVTDVVQASLGLGDWESYGLGGANTT